MSGERLQDYLSSGYIYFKTLGVSFWEDLQPSQHNLGHVELISQTVTAHT